MLWFEMLNCPRLHIFTVTKRRREGDGGKASSSGQEAEPAVVFKEPSKDNRGHSRSHLIKVRCEVLSDRQDSLTTCVQFIKSGNILVQVFHRCERRLIRVSEQVNESTSADYITEHRWVTVRNLD